MKKYRVQFILNENYKSMVDTELLDMDEARNIYKDCIEKIMRDYKIFGELPVFALSVWDNCEEEGVNRYGDEIICLDTEGERIEVRNGEIIRIKEENISELL